MTLTIMKQLREYVVRMYRCGCTDNKIMSMTTQTFFNAIVGKKIDISKLPSTSTYPTSDGWYINYTTVPYTYVIYFNLSYSTTNNFLIEFCIDCSGTGCSQNCIGNNPVANLNTIGFSTLDKNNNYINSTIPIDVENMAISSLPIVGRSNVLLLLGLGGMALGIMFTTMRKNN